MEKAILKIHSLTDKLNGYGMPIVNVKSNIYFEATNIGYNEFEPTVEIDETDLLRLRNMFNTCVHDTVMLEITMPKRESPKPVWYKLTDLYIGGKGSNLIF